MLLAGLATSGSTCHNQSGSDVTKDAPAPQGVEITLPGVDTSALTPREKREWSGYVSELLSPCPNVPVSIAQCVNEKRDCARCLPAAKFVLKGVRDGQSREQVEKAYKNRFDADKVKNVPLDGSPSRGPENAAITIVEFADFECPFCGVVAPMIDKAVEQRKNQVRFVYKFFPLPSHPHAEIAAKAAVAAAAQGKFWEMHRKLFSNQQHLEQSDIDTYAKDLGLDVAKLHADMQKPETADRIERDKKLGASLEINGTPSVFINGRLWDPHQDLAEWIGTELSLTGPSASPGGATAADGGAPAGSDAGAAKASGSASAPGKAR